MPQPIDLEHECHGDEPDGKMQNHGVKRREKRPPKKGAMRSSRGGTRVGAESRQYGGDDAEQGTKKRKLRAGRVRGNSMTSARF